MWDESIMNFSWFIVILRCDVDVSYIWTSGDILKVMSNFIISIEPTDGSPGPLTLLLA